MGTDQLISRMADLLWLGGLAATPLAILVGVACRWKTLRPATRHILWFAALASFVTPALGAMIWTPQWFRSDRVIAAAESVLGSTTGGVNGATGQTTDVAIANLSDGANKLEANTVETKTVDTKTADTKVRAKVETVDTAALRTENGAARTPAATAPFRRIASDNTLASAGRTSQAKTEPERFPKELQKDAGSGGSWHLTNTAAGQTKELVCEPPSPTPDCSMSEDMPRETTLLNNPSAGEPGTCESGAGSAGNSICDEASTTPPPAPQPTVAGTLPSTPGLESAPGPTTPNATTATPVAAAPVLTSMPASAWSDMRAWLVRLLGVRDAIAALPRIPGVVWIGGALVLMGLSVIRTMLAQRWLRGATPAGPDVQAAVRQVGGVLGLTRVPRAVFVDKAVSPMIWCGLRPVLVLPSALWQTLDQDSRRAVLVHELAHVRRGDHVLCWVQAAIGAVYWWHPVVWWARRRLHDEAEASCDAWVTSLFPSDRRAYASALIVTKSYLSSQGSAGGPWLGAVSSSAKKMARRITMVMTEKAAPKMSLIGACVATLVVTVGSFVMAGIACPPEGNSEVAGASAGRTPGKVKVRVSGTRNVAPRSAATAVEPGQSGMTFFGEAPALEAMKSGDGSVMFVRPEAGSDANLAPRPARAPKVIRVPGLGAAPMAPMTPMDPMAAMPPTSPNATLAPMTRYGSVSGTTGMGDLEQLKVGRTAREYVLAPQKLQCFYSLMSRNDVPILVELKSDRNNTIIIWGNDDEHVVFGKFIKIIGRGDRGQGSSGGGRGGAGGGGARSVPRVEGVEWGGDANSISKDGPSSAAIAGNLAHSRAGRAEEMQQYRSALDELTRNRDQYQAGLEKARQEVETARERVEQLGDVAQELRGKAAEMAMSDERKALEQVATRLHGRAELLNGETRTTEDRLARLERQIEAIERRAERLGEMLGDLNELDEDPNINIDEGNEEPEVFILEEMDGEEADEAEEAPSADTRP